MNSYLLLLINLLLGATLVQADQKVLWSGTGDITFSGTSTLHDWAGKVAASPFSATVVYDESGRPQRIQAKVSVEAGKMDTAEPKRDENMKQALNVPIYPLIQASLDAPAEKIAADGKTPTRLPMTLMLLGKSHKIVAEISDWKLSAKKATFDLDFDVSMKASGISVPPVLIFIRVGDAVKVHASVTLTQN
ncbi:YceI-like domain-containing protein [Prosthecobacter fusiformis]|uniref:YceI-like domain-containing protein n=1 Tax=Prosthecobacter fusiformis TaxID=48464 RepID=A0A4R7RLE6_9BACT|nr:YceI family protein [Prosthecobacter fusiformis]TDU66170.1 YceI-like domain-containing protein [Prosthecobacter fusiformis]